MSAKDGHISPEGENSLLGRGARRSLTVAGRWFTATGSWSHGLSVSERYPRLSPLRWGVVRCPRRSRAFLFRQSSISALWPLLSASVGRARSPAGSKGGERSRVLPGKAISVSSRWWLASLLAAATVTKSTFRPVPAESQAWLAPASPLSLAAWSDERRGQPASWGESQPGEIKQSPISALFR